MCYKAGPRCPSVALLAIEKAEHKWESAKNISERNTAMGEIMEAKHQYDLTIQGQKQIEATIETAKLQGETAEVLRLQDRLESVRNERKALLEKIGVQDTKKDAKHSYEIPTSKEKPSERTTRLLDMINVETASLSTSEGWKGHLDTAGNFPTLPFNNQILIKAQDPEATSLNTYEDWAKSGRAVRRNSQGVYLLTPTVINEKKKDPQSGALKTVSKITGFRSVATFDVKATVGKKPETPEVDLPAYNGHLSDKLGNYGYSVEEVDPRKMKGRPSFTSIENKKVYLSKGLTEASQTEALSRELGHIGLGHDKGPARDAKEELSRRVEAQSLSYILTKKAGIDTDANFEGIDEWAKTSSPKYYAERVSKAAKYLLT